MVGEDIVITVVDVKDNQVKIGVSAPRDIPVDREEIYNRKRRERICDSA